MANDSLLSSSGIRMFGRVIEGVTLDPNVITASGAMGANRLLIEQLLQDATDPDKRVRLARIYAISFEGKFYNLPKPTIFIVHTGGMDPQNNTGVAATTELKFETDVKCWHYDKDDVSLRADIITGTLEDILLDATLSPTSKYPIISRAGTPQEASWRDGQMIQRNRLQQ